MGSQGDRGDGGDGQLVLAPDPRPEAKPERVHDAAIPVVLSWDGPLSVIFEGDCAAVMAGMDDDSIDAIVTDPPYGLSKQPDVVEVLTHWLRGDDYTHRGGGFMGKSWDSFVPGPAVWREALRVLKPGAYLLCFAGSRTVDLMGMAIRLAGFEIVDQMQWLYGQGFPKGLDIGRGVDTQLCTLPGKHRWTEPPSPKPDAVWHICPRTPEGESHDGEGTALKPAHEPIVVARKPLIGTYAANILEYGTGAFNIDGCRIGISKDVPASISRHAARDHGVYEGNQDGSWGNEQGGGGSGHDPNIGRWPANVVLGHHPECQQRGTKKIRGSNTKPEHVGLGREGQHTKGIYGAKASKVTVSHTDADGMETIEDWDCHSDCAVRLADEQSGVRKSSGVYLGDGSRRSDSRGVTSFEQADDRHRPNVMYADKGGASRFFYHAKVSKADRGRGLPDGLKNGHPTVKPVGLIRYLMRLVTPPDGVVFDLYMGSGSSGVAAIEEGFDFVGADLNAEVKRTGKPSDNYILISRYRISDALRRAA